MTCAGCGTELLDVDPATEPLEVGDFVGHSVWVVDGRITQACGRRLGELRADR